MAQGQRDNPEGRSERPRDDLNTPRTTRQHEEPKGGTVPQLKAQRAKRHHERSRDNTAGQTTRCRAQKGCGQRNDDAITPRTTRTVQGRLRHREDDPRGPVFMEEPWADSRHSSINNVVMIL